MNIAVSSLVLVFCASLFLSSCAEFKKAGRSIGHGTRDAAKAIGHGTKRVVKKVTK